MTAPNLPPHLFQLFEPGDSIIQFKSKSKTSFKPMSSVGAFLPTSLKINESNIRNDNDLNKSESKLREFQWSTDAHEKELHQKNLNKTRFLKECVNNYDPVFDNNPFKTLFLSNLPFDLTEQQLESILLPFGPIRGINMIRNQKGQPKGYAFVEFEHESSQRDSYKQLFNLVIHGRKIIVDKQRARIDDRWLPRRLGGGIGPGNHISLKKKMFFRKKKYHKNDKRSGRRRNFEPTNRKTFH
eukprot:TRINITY_DN6063_c0_g1_i1.p1 TRINITY_DN6063_c0_g1~~TRINITY_DN6063_c0_g1_i1.p1  ORF type:complete len:241 (-),score=42.85 TRINITY_DN6063_c0_g1_i1:51-773(-)